MGMGGADKGGISRVFTGKVICKTARAGQQAEIFPSSDRRADAVNWSPMLLYFRDS